MNFEGQRVSCEQQLNMGQMVQSLLSEALSSSFIFYSKEFTGIVQSYFPALSKSHLMLDKAKTTSIGDAVQHQGNSMLLSFRLR